ncbi:hypothetical protein MBAV_000797 [Candidatus Magnetobacterium bavaricum]|uniref:Uncharacterized protein n=1 Tax=Candidatus Magnetobacterium bavaricum TaxID=29290 RepID=A0A0F3GYQ3_9BACT|nr:hypothetical protein MBAV_000797 [Candidatus Magnetobacterium bavaricum]
MSTVSISVSISSGTKRQTSSMRAMTSSIVEPLRMSLTLSCSSLVKSMLPREEGMAYIIFLYLTTL